MSTKSHSIVMLRRNFKHIARNPTSVFNAVLMPDRDHADVRVHVR